MLAEASVIGGASAMVVEGGGSMLLEGRSVTVGLRGFRIHYQMRSRTICNSQLDHNVVCSQL